MICNIALEVPVCGKGPLLSSGRSHPRGVEDVNCFEGEKNGIQNQLACPRPVRCEHARTLPAPLVPAAAQIFGSMNTPLCSQNSLSAAARSNNVLYVMHMFPLHGLASSSLYGSIVPHPHGGTHTGGYAWHTFRRLCLVHISTVNGTY